LTAILGFSVWEASAPWRGRRFWGCCRQPWRR